MPLGASVIEIGIDLVSAGCRKVGDFVLSAVSLHTQQKVGFEIV